MKTLTEITKEEADGDGGRQDAQVHQLIGRHRSAEKQNRDQRRHGAAADGVVTEHCCSVQLGMLSEIVAQIPCPFRIVTSKCHIHQISRH